MKTKFIFIVFIAVLLLTVCQRSTSPISFNKKDVILEYKYMNGWTGRISVINIYKNMQGTSNMGAKDIIFDFSEEEKKVMDSLLTSFSKFEKEYTSDGPIYCDIDYHWLAYFNKMTTDSITIYIPLSSEQIPASLRRYIKLLLTKFWNQSSSPPLWLRPVY